MSRVRLRPPQLPRIQRARRLTPTEAAALRARPWPKLPWWLWLAALVTTLAMVVVAIGLFRAAPAPLPVAERRSPPTAAAELAARKAELDACGRLFTGDVQPNRSCADAATLLAAADATVLDELRKAGYR